MLISFILLFIFFSNLYSCSQINKKVNRKSFYKKVDREHYYHKKVGLYWEKFLQEPFSRKVLLKQLHSIIQEIRDISNYDITILQLFLPNIHFNTFFGRFFWSCFLFTEYKSLLVHHCVDIIDNLNLENLKAPVILHVQSLESFSYEIFKYMRELEEDFVDEAIAEETIKILRGGFSFLNIKAHYSLFKLPLDVLS